MNASSPPATVSFAIALALLGGCDPATPSAEAAPAGFWDHWGDGRGELSGFALTQPRYGEDRPGQSVMIFVTEPFLEGERVKPGQGKGDVQVMKLNWVKDFQTGIYDYNVMTSVYMPLEATGGRALGIPTRITFSSQEWCGSVMTTLLFDAHRIRRQVMSYFEGESRSDAFDLPEGAVAADALPLIARGAFGPLPPIGEAQPVQMLPSVLTARMRHVPLAFEAGTLLREAPRALPLPGGDAPAETWTLKGPTETFTLRVSPDAPRQILGWSRSDGERAVLTGSARLPYWQLHGQGDEAGLKALGLSPLPGPEASPPGSTSGP